MQKSNVISTSFNYHSKSVIFPDKNYREFFEIFKHFLGFGIEGEKCLKMIKIVKPSPPCLKVLSESLGLCGKIKKQ